MPTSQYQKIRNTSMAAALAAAAAKHTGGVPDAAVRAFIDWAPRQPPFKVRLAFTSLGVARQLDVLAELRGRQQS